MKSKIFYWCLLFAMPVVTGVLSAMYERIATAGKGDYDAYRVVNFIMETLPVMLWLVFANRVRLVWQFTNWWMVAYSLGGLAISITWWVCTRRVGVAKTGAFEAAYPVFVLLFSAIFNGRHVRSLDIVGITLVTLGVVLLSTHI